MSSIEKRSQRIAFRVTPKELRYITRSARLLNLTLTGLMRSALKTLLNPKYTDTPRKSLHPEKANRRHRP